MKELIQRAQRRDEGEPFGRRKPVQRAQNQDADKLSNMSGLIQRAQGRDAEAFTALMQSQMQHLYKTARAILRSDEDAADAIQDTILACWERLPELRSERYFRTWMTRILVNRCTDIIRRNERVFLTDVIEERGSLESEYANIEWKDALAQIDEKYRLVLLLYYVEGFRTGEIAEILGVPEGTVRTRLRRGRERLAAICATDTGSKRPKALHSRSIGGPEQDGARS